MIAGISAGRLYSTGLMLLLGGATCIAPASAQLPTASELVRFPPNLAPTYSSPPGSMPLPEYSMCTGHKDPATGAEFAVAGTENGIFFAHIPTPRSAADDLSTATFDTWFFEESPTSRWRGVISFGDLVYALQPFHPGIRRFRVDATRTGAGRVVDLGYALTTQLQHGLQRLSVDAVHGHLYVCGADANLGRSALCIYDVFDESTGAVIDPPQLLAVWSPGGTVVDTVVTEDRIYVAYQPANDPRWWQILDRTALPRSPSQAYAWSPPWGQWRNSVPGGAQLSHDGYVSPDGNTWFTTTEGHGFMTARDISRQPPLTVMGTALPEPPIIGSYDSSSTVPMHALEGIGMTGYVSHWGLGLHVIDLSVRPGGLGLDYPRIAEYGTSNTGSTQIGDGAWDCHPHQDSGLVYVADSEEGLIVLRLDQGHLNRYGPGRPNALGIPRLVANQGPPRIGRRFVLTGERMQPNTASILAIGFGEDPGYLAGAPLVVGGITILIDPNLALAYVYMNGAEGSFDHALPIPNIPAFIGARLFTQAVEMLPGLQFASTRGTWFGLAN